MRITAPRTELGSVVSEELSRSRPRPGGPRVVVNLSLQPPNSLLHDGRAWRRFQPARIVALTRSAQREAAEADFLVHASYVFAGAAPATAGARLRPLIEAARRAEDMVLSGDVPACVVRLGYLYGPRSRNLRAYRRAFRLGRPYWAGPVGVEQQHLHTADAARALLAAARSRRAGALLAASDDLPVSFARFMDEFANLIGNPVPLHLLRFSRPLARLIVAEEHMQMVELPTGALARGPRPAGFAPRFADYRSGLREVVDAWAR
jgi:hypothetical protein